MKVMTVVGTRPELIRLSRTIHRLEESVDHVLVHTGQNYDHALNAVFFDDLRLRPPDHYLGVDTSSLGAVLGGILIKIEAVLREERPDAFLVLGDTNSSIAAIIAKRLKVPIYHMEAGNRSFDPNVPEEVNRRLVDHLADFNLVYTEHARRNLLAEGLHPRRTLLTGSPMREVLTHFRPDIDASTVLDRLGLTASGYFLVSAHREENVDHPARLGRLLASIRLLVQRWGLPVIVSTHPRTRLRLEQAGTGYQIDGVTFAEPFGFHDYNRLQLAAACVLSDSGTISEESAILGFPAVTIRDSMERPEALEAGTLVMCGLEPTEVADAVGMTMSQYAAGARPDIPGGYEITDTSLRALRIIASTASRHGFWAGLRDSDG